jgi:hypothetical protein
VYPKLSRNSFSHSSRSSLSSMQRTILPVFFKRTCGRIVLLSVHILDLGAVRNCTLPIYLGLAKEEKSRTQESSALRNERPYEAVVRVECRDCRH